MKKEDARSLLVAEWLALPKHQRSTLDQAAQFAAEHQRDYTFKTTGGRDAAILRWIRNHL